MNPLFWLILLVITAAVSHQWHWWQRRSGGRRTDTSWPALSGLDAGEWPLEEGTWAIEDVAVMATNDRIRAVIDLTLRERQASRRRQALQLLAREVYRHIEAQAVFIVARHGANEPDLYLLAPDGRGWWGSEIVGTAIAGPGFESRRRR